jgi:integrator complex subunit 7
LTTGERVSTLFHRLSSDPEVKPISDRHTQCLLSAVTTLASSPTAGLPRFFFQSLQTTTLKLAVTPQPRAGGEPLTVSSSQQLAIKVEGVITSAALSSTPRAVKAIHLSLQSSLVSAAKNATAAPNEKPLSDAGTVQHLEQRAVPHNDFFTAQFLVTFPTAGAHQVVIETQLVDDEERFWKSGQRPALMNVKAFEDTRGVARGSR